MNKGIYWKCIHCGYAHADDICPNCSRDGIAAFHFPPERTWIGLNLDDLPEIYVGDKSFLRGARWAETKLKERNT